MKRILGSVTCLALAAIGSVALLRGNDEASETSKQSTPYSYKFSKHGFGTAGRTNFNLDVTLSRPDLIVAAVCDVRDEKQQGIGRFSLGNVNADDADAPVRFRISCLANTYINKSTIRVEIRERKTKKHIGVLEVSLRDAEPKVVGTSVKER